MDEWNRISYPKTDLPCDGERSPRVANPGAGRVHAREKRGGTLSHRARHLELDQPVQFEGIVDGELFRELR